MTFLYDFAAKANGLIGYSVITAIPLVIFVIIVARQLIAFRVDLVTIALVLSALPMLTPWLADILGFRHFTALNYGLQANSSLKVAAVLLITLFCISFYAGAQMHGRDSRIRPAVPVKIDLLIVEFLFVCVFFLLLRYLESDTILSTPYAVIKEASSPYNSTVNQAFNLFAAVFLNYVRGRQKPVAIMYICVVLWALLVARRTLAIGAIIMIVYSLGGKRFTVRQIVGLGSVVAALWFIGIARSAGIFNYFEQDPVRSVINYFSLPGGASNVFVGSMGVIDLTNSGVLRGSDAMPILSWLQGRTESQIYPDYGYQYNGGMHIANIFYWNFGLIGVILGGLAMGWITQKSHLLLRRLSTTGGGTLGAMLAAGFAITLPNTLWYSPIAIIKLSLGIIFLYSLLRFAIAATSSGLASSQRAHR